MVYSDKYLKRKSFVLGVVILIGVILGIFVLSIVRMQSSYSKISIKNIQQYKLKYMARAVINMIKLKVKFMPTELYDAILLTKLKNPYFDWSKPINMDKTSSNYNPGPKYLYTQTDNPVTLINTYAGKLNKLIEVYLKDCLNLNFPFNANVQVEKFKILSMKGNKKYNKELLSIKLLIDGGKEGKWKQEEILEVSRH